MSEAVLTDDTPPDTPGPESLPEIEVPSVYKPYKVFLNHVDSYNAKYIAAFITDQTYGLSKFIRPPGGPDEGLGEGEGEEPPKPPPQDLPTNKYEVIGTLSGFHREPTEDILFTIDDFNKDNEDKFREEILRCGVIVYDITSNPNEISKALNTLSILTAQLDEIALVGPKTYENFQETKIFVLISTVMTWALTKPLDPTDPDLPFSEVDYRKRRPHPNYKEHYNCEKEVIKVGQNYKDKLKTYVVCAGHIYGEEEDILEFYFKMAWYNETLPIFDTGNNRIPFIHVRDFARALHGVIEIAPPKPQYILAVEPTPTSLKQFIKTLSKTLSDGKYTHVVAEEAFLYKNMTQTIFERSTINLYMEPVFLVENLQLQWQSEAGIAENMEQVVKEFKTRRKLKPVKIIVHGPPGCGKTYLATKLSEYYNSKYVSVETMLKHFIEIWQESLNKPERPKPEDTEYLGEEEVEEEIEEEEEDPQQVLDQIRETQILMEGGIDKMPDDFITGLLKTYLAKSFCQNRGYVLDDYPQFTAQAKELFGQSANAMEEEEEAAPVDLEKILPDLVVSLVATDELIINQIKKKQEEEIHDTPYEEDVILRRLEAYREIDTEENTVLNYFDELEVDILLLEVKGEDYEEEFAIVANQMGLPISFGLTPEEMEALRQLEEQEKDLMLEKDELHKQLMLKKAEEERKNKMELWTDILEKLQMEEEKILVAQSEPLRHYLMKYVFPTLTKGLIEVASVKPNDPVDYLAEFLFRENPEGKIFDPAYNIEGEDIYGECRGYIEKIIEGEAFN